MKFSITVSSWILLNLVVDPVNAARARGRNRRRLDDKSRKAGPSVAIEPARGTSFGTCADCHNHKTACPNNVWAYTNNLIPDSSFLRDVAGEIVVVTINSQAYESFCPAVILEPPTANGVIQGACKGLGFNLEGLPDIIDEFLPQFGHIQDTGLKASPDLSSIFGQQFNKAMGLFESNSGKVMSHLQSYAAGLSGSFGANIGNETNSTLYDGGAADSTLQGFDVASLLSGFSQASLFGAGAFNLDALSSFSTANHISLPDFQIPVVYDCSLSYKTEAGSLSMQGELPSAETCVWSLLTSGGLGAILNYGSSFPPSLDGKCCSTLAVTGGTLDYKAAQGDVRVCQTPSVLQELIISVFKQIVEFANQFYPTILLLWTLGAIADIVIIKLAGLVFIVGIIFYLFLESLESDLLGGGALSGIKGQLEQMVDSYGLADVYSVASGLFDQETASNLQGIFMSSLGDFAASEQGASFFEAFSGFGAGLGEAAAGEEFLYFLESLHVLVKLLYTGIFGLYFDFSGLEGCDKNQCCNRAF